MVQHGTTIDSPQIGQLLKVTTICGDGRAATPKGIKKRKKNYNKKKKKKKKTSHP
jgi:hypothetical protein